MLIITIEIVARGILARISGEAGGVQARADPQSRVFRPNIFGDEPAHGQRCRRFITMNTTGKIDFAMSTCRGAMQCQKANIVFSFQPVDRPPVGLGCSETIIENILNNDGLATITAIIQTTRIHGLGRYRLGSFSGGTGFLLITTAPARVIRIKLRPIRVEPEIAQHLQILFHRLI